MLVVDDQDSTRVAVAAVLDQHGHRVIEADTAEWALEQFLRHRPDIVLLDVEMPGYDGYWVARRIREMEPDGWTPIIYLSGQTQALDLWRGIEAGGDDYLVKPVSPVVLLAKLRAMHRLVDMRRRLVAVSSELREANERLQGLSVVDALTGLLNRRGLEAAAELLPPGLSLHTTSLAGIPLYDGDVEAQGIPAAVLRLRDEIAVADGVLFASPEYNFSVTGVLKNAIDWLSRTSPQPFKDKPVAMFSVTGGPVGGARNQYDLRKILGCLEAIALPRPEVFIGLSATKFNAEGQLTDATSRKVMGDQLVAFEAWIRRVGQPAPQ